MLKSINRALLMQPNEVPTGAATWQLQCGAATPEACLFEVRDAGESTSIFLCSTHRNALRVSDDIPPLLVARRLAESDEPALLAALQRMGSDAGNLFSAPMSIEEVDYAEVLRGFLRVMDARVADVPADVLPGDPVSEGWLRGRAEVIEAMHDELAALAGFTPDQVRDRYRGPKRPAGE